MIGTILLLAMIAETETASIHQIRSDPIRFLGKRVMTCGKGGSPLPRNYIWEDNEYGATVATQFRLHYSAKKLSVGDGSRICMTGIFLRRDGKKVGDPTLFSRSLTHAPADEAYYLDVIAISDADAGADASGLPIKQ